jgi:hypothetical protein
MKYGRWTARTTFPRGGAPSAGSTDNGRIRKAGGKLLGINNTKLKDLVEESLSYLFDSVGYEPDIFAEEFPKLLGEKPSAWTGL